MTVRAARGASVLHDRAARNQILICRGCRRRSAGTRNADQCAKADREVGDDVWLLWGRAERARDQIARNRPGVPVE